MQLFISYIDFNIKYFQENATLEQEGTSLKLENTMFQKMPDWNKQMLGTNYVRQVLAGMSVKSPVCLYNIILSFLEQYRTQLCHLFH